MSKFFCIVIFTIISTYLECCEVNILNVYDGEVFVLPINHENKLFLSEANSNIKLLILPWLKDYGKVWLDDEKDIIPKKFENCEKISHKEFKFTYELLLSIWNEKLKELEKKIGIVEEQYTSEKIKQKCITNVLHKAIKHKFPILVKFLLQRGAKNNKTDHFNRMPQYYLHFTEDDDNAVEIAKLFIKNEEDLEKSLDPLGSTVVSLATENNKLKLLEYYDLLKKNNNPT